jgi:hypothetical protein
LVQVPGLSYEEEVMSDWGWSGDKALREQLQEDAATHEEPPRDEDEDEPKREWTDEQKAAARSMVSAYERHVEMLWDERVFELGISLGLEEEEAEELVDEVR